MKKMYKQPIVEQVPVQGGLVMDTASPAGISGGGPTSVIPGTDPIPGD